MDYNITDAFAIVLKAVMEPLSWFVSMLYSANALVVYVAFFFISVLIRLFIKPIVGEAHREVAAELKKYGKDTYSKMKGDN